MSFTKEEIHNIVIKQREYFLTNETLNVKFRKEQLKKLKAALLENEKQLTAALHGGTNSTKCIEYRCSCID